MAKVQVTVKVTVDCEAPCYHPTVTRRCPGCQTLSLGVIKLAEAAFELLSAARAYCRDTGESSVCFPLNATNREATLAAAEALAAEELVEHVSFASGYIKVKLLERDTNGKRCKD